MRDPFLRLKATLRRLAPRGVRAHRILGGHLRGRIIVTSLYDYPAAIFGRTERALLAWFQETVKEGETWLDVGAHYGYTSIALAELVGHDGHVLAFEPSLTVVGHLNRTRGLNGLNQMTVLPFGLSEPGGIRMISVPMCRGMANHSIGGDSTEDIFVIGFDDLWGAIGGGPIHGVKIDVQGMELQVLKGMSHALRDQHPRIAVEFHPRVDRAQIIALLRDAGYQSPAIPLEPLSGEDSALYVDDRSYVFEHAQP